MTLIIGIVLAAESQPTMPTPGKMLGTDKIHVIEFEQAKVLVAEAGRTNPSNRQLNFLKKGQGAKIENEETVLNLAKEFMLEGRRALILFLRSKQSTTASSGLFVENNKTPATFIAGVCDFSGPD
jgi:hypothetical protein